MSAILEGATLTDADYREAAGRPFEAKKREGFRPVALHLYRKAEGSILYACVRMHKQTENGGREKLIRPFWLYGLRERSEQAANESDDAALTRLAALPITQYDRVRKEEAKRLGVQVATLDKLVTAARDEHDARGPIALRRSSRSSPRSGRQSLRTCAALQTIRRASTPIASVRSFTPTADCICRGGGPRISVDDMRRLLAELIEMIETLASMKHWAHELRDDGLGRANADRSPTCY